MVVEDNQIIATEVERILKKGEYHSSSVRKGKEAIDYLNRNKNKSMIVISDIDMPEMDGFQLCQQIKANSDLEEIPVILLVSLSSLDDIIKCFQCGADSFVHKPPDEQTLLSRIHSILKNNEIRKEPKNRFNVEAFCGEQKHCINTNNMQIVGILFSMYDAFTQKNRELEQISSELSKLKESEAKLRDLSFKDELTDTFNRKVFITLVEQQLKIASRTKSGKALFLIDVDNLKLINDTMGHEMGDKALKHVATVLKRTFRQADIIGRIGGDEFAALLIEAKKDNEKSISDRLQKNLEDYIAKESIRYNLSINIAFVSYDPTYPCSIDELLSWADTFMYNQRRRNIGMGG
ncbi:MAG: response regulator receiver modulated diguanylate cyclase [Candidatus Brocadiaceae bacterium]|nr:response regulator receiver modulated diguanylate cyclase [Candidatus Brocadiaceae bacterium]